LKCLLFLLALDAKGGVCLQFIHVGWCVSSCFIYLSIYLSILGCRHVWTFLCGVMDAGEPRTF
jgi:hypothetical protein